MPDVKHFDRADALAAVERLFWRQGVSATGIQDIVTATGLSRSSLYNAFGSKEEVYLAVLRRYLDQRSRPMFDRLASDDRGLPAISAFFERLIQLRCTGEHARWGCLISNAHTEQPGEAASNLLDRHHDELRSAFATALEVAYSKGQLRPDVDRTGTAELLTLLAYGLNLRSRSGTSRADLNTGIQTALRTLIPVG
jgi:TetR/AcrR family transcriptional repressor of nem operon